MNEQPTDEKTSEDSTDGPLLAALREMIRTHGHEETAELLGVSVRTLFRMDAAGRLTAPMHSALALHLLSGPGVEASAPDTRGTALKQRIEALEERVDTLAGEVRTDLAAIRDEVRGLRESRSGDGPGGAAATPAPPSVQGAPDEVIGERAVPKPRRSYPDVVTREAEEGEELVYGEAAPLIAEWRRQRGAYLDTSLSRVERATGHVRMRELELELIAERGLTLPPATYPWDGLRRRSELRSREASLRDARRDRRWALCRRRLTLGLWRR